MNTTIMLFLVQDGITNGAIYALLGLALVLVFAVTRVILIPQRAIGDELALRNQDHARDGEHQHQREPEQRIDRTIGNAVLHQEQHDRRVQDSPAPPEHSAGRDPCQAGLVRLRQLKNACGI